MIVYMGSVQLMYFGMVWCGDGSYGSTEQTNKSYSNPTSWIFNLSFKANALLFFQFISSEVICPSIPEIVVVHM
jgi:hypothetical protein